MICIRPEKENSYQQFREYAETCAIVLACSFAAAFALSCVLQRSISGPVLKLVKATPKNNKCGRLFDPREGQCQG